MAEPRRCALLCGAPQPPPSSPCQPPPPPPFSRRGSRSPSKAAPLLCHHRGMEPRSGFGGCTPGPPPAARCGWCRFPHTPASAFCTIERVFVSRLHRVCTRDLGQWRNVTLCRRVSPGRLLPERVPLRSSAAPGFPRPTPAARSQHRGAFHPPRLWRRPPRRGTRRRSRRVPRGPSLASGTGRLREAGRVRPPRGDGMGRAARPVDPHCPSQGTDRAPSRSSLEWKDKHCAGLQPCAAQIKAGIAGRGLFSKQTAQRRFLRAGGLKAPLPGGATGGVLLSQLPHPRTEPLPGLSAAERDGANSTQMTRSAARTALLSAEPCVRPGSAFSTGESLQVGGEGRRESPGSKCWT